MAGGLLVVPEERGQDLALDLRSRRRAAPADEPHDRRIAIELDEIVDIGFGEQAQDQAIGVEVDLHQVRLRYRNSPSVCPGDRPRMSTSRMPPETAKPSYGVKSLV